MAGCSHLQDLFVRFEGALLDGLPSGPRVWFVGGGGCGQFEETHEAMLDTGPGLGPRAEAQPWGEADGRR